MEKCGEKNQMKLEFKPLTVEAVSVVRPYFGLRSNRTCDSVPLESFIWRKYYHVRYAISRYGGVQWLMEHNGRYVSAMPICSEENLRDCFEEIVAYFNEELHQPFEIFLADEEGVKALGLTEQTDRFLVEERTELRDYLYDGEKLRTLSGRKLHKKKNNLNFFQKSYEGRYEYRSLNCVNRDEIWRFLDKWRVTKGEDVEKHLDYEVEGIHDILKNCGSFSIRMGGVYIDGQLEGFTIGSYNQREDMAIIHIEKANPEIRGLYQYINQQFLVHEFPNVPLVNREDDLGLEGLRKAKMSYAPIDFAKKYKVLQLPSSWQESCEP